MAHSLLSPLPSLMTIKGSIKPISFNPKLCYVPLMADVKTITIMSNKQNQTILRRSGNYQPTIWNHEFVESLTSEFKGETYESRSIKLKEDVKGMLRKVAMEPIEKLELIDNLQRLGISYHFEDEINEILNQRHKKSHWDIDDWNCNLHQTALEFRLLRQHGFNIPPNVFNNLRDEMGNFKAFVCEDIKGMLTLHEASYLSKEGEILLEEARFFTAKHLAKYVSSGENIGPLFELVKHDLELPLHWKVPRLEARWYIDFYKRREDKNSTLLELAELDFNLVQSIHQEDLKYTSRWWMNTGLGQKLSFGRDRLVENFFWTVGIAFEPQFSSMRRMTTKIAALITIIDDIYDIYGTLDELQLFTTAVERWDTDAMDQLPDYMKICFLALHNTINEMAFDALKDQGVHVIQFLRKTWLDLCKSYLVEAKWYNSNYSPTFQEYMDNAWISISGPLTLIHLYVFVENPIKMEDLKSLKDYPDIIRWSSIIFRLENDTDIMSSDELKRGDTPKSIECYMSEKGVSKEKAVEHMRNLINETWKKINEVGSLNSCFSQNYIKCVINLVRMAKFMYQQGEHGAEQQTTREQVLPLLIESLPISFYTDIHNNQSFTL